MLRPLRILPFFLAAVFVSTVTPDVEWVGPAPGQYDKTTDAQRNLAISGLHDSLCRPN